MQRHPKTDSTELFDRLVAAELPEHRGVATWQAFLRAHAALMRRLDSQLRSETGFGLGEFDVLAQLAQAGGELRMSELAARVFASRSAMTRRVDRLVEAGVLERSAADGDARGTVVALTAVGIERLKKVLPVHVRGVRELFVAQLDDGELALLAETLAKVTPHCDFG
jgi:DNA-binding MarR family transcriptional regulator